MCAIDYVSPLSIAGIYFAMPLSEAVGNRLRVKSMKRWILDILSVQCRVSPSVPGSS